MRLHTRIFILIISLIFIKCDDKKSVISGKIENGNGNFLFLEEITPAGTITKDSVKIKSAGNFKFSIKQDFPIFYALKMHDRYIKTLLKPGERLQLHINADSFNVAYNIIEGSDDNKKLKELELSMFKTLSYLDSLKKVYIQISHSNSSDTSLQSIAEKYDARINEQRKNAIGFILQNTNSLTSYAAVYQKLDEETFLLNKKRDVQFFKILTDSLKKYYPNSRYVKQLENNAKILVGNVNTDKFRQLIEQSDNSLPEIRLPDKNGDTIALSSLKNKITLLNFWASINKISVEENLGLLNLYKKYHKKGFEIYSVSLDTGKNAWLRQIKFDEIPWINVCDFKGAENYAAAIYNIQELPTHYLIDKDHTTVLGKNLSYNELNNKLNKLLK